MATDTTPRRQARTVLEQLIWDRRQTLEEFAESVDRFAREHGESGTLSVRHLQRLVTGGKPGGRPLGPVRPATARLLERVLGLSVDELLTQPHRLVRSCGGHILTVAVAIVVDGNQVLLVRRRTSGGEGGWQFPAGIIKPGVDPSSVAVQETFSETNVHCVVQGDLGHRIHPVTHVACRYLLCRYVAGRALNVDAAENAAVAWVDHLLLTSLVHAEQVHQPVLDALGLSNATVR